jgi:hypothetical protein
LRLPSCQPCLVPGLTVIVPHGGGARLPLLRATLRHLPRPPMLDRVVVVELGTAPSQLPAGLADFHVFAHGAPPFHKTRAMNIGLAFVRTTHFLWLDGDILLPADFLEAALDECVARDLDCLLPWNAAHYLSPIDSLMAAHGHCDPAHCVPNRVFPASPSVPGHAVLVRTAFAHRYGGMPEQFRGWGCEDNAWFSKVRVLGRIAITERNDRVLYHLYHARSGGYSDLNDLFDRPEYRRNFALLALLKSRATPEAFTQRFPPPAWFTPPWEGVRELALPPEDEMAWLVLRELYGPALTVTKPTNGRTPEEPCADPWTRALTMISRPSDPVRHLSPLP